MNSRVLHASTIHNNLCTQAKLPDIIRTIPRKRMNQDAIFFHPCRAIMESSSKRWWDRVMEWFIGVNEKSSSESILMIIHHPSYTLMIHSQQKESLKGVKINPLFFLNDPKHYSLLVLGPSLGPSSVEHNPDWSPLVTHVHRVFFLFRVYSKKSVLVGCLLASGVCFGPTSSPKPLN